MSITSLVEALVASGATPEMILAAVRNAETQKDAAINASKEKARLRVKNWRDRNVTERSETPGNAQQRLTSEPAHVEVKPSTQSLRTESKKVIKAFRLSDDWQLPVDWHSDAVEAGLPCSLIALEASKMRDWSRSSKNGVKLDWRAAWRNWCREAAARPQARGSPKKLTLSGAFDEFTNYAETKNENRDRDGFGGAQAAIPHLSVVSGR